MADQLDFYDQSALAHRLTSALKKRSQEVVFLLGSALSAPIAPGAPGVTNTEGLIDAIKGEFADDPRQASEIEKIIAASGEKRYEAAFLFLQGRMGQTTANEIVRDAVMRARSAISTGHATGLNARTASDDQLRQLELDSGWCLNPGTAAVGNLVARYPGRFGRVLLTTNFDPLLEVAIRMAGGEFYRTVLHADGNLSQTEGSGCHVVHLHGYWYGSDTLHTNRQLQQSRPHLKASLTAVLRRKLILVCGYGGWDDVFTDALMELVRDDSESPEVLWAFRDERMEIPATLMARLVPGLSRGRVSLYSGVDCNSLFPAISDTWATLEANVVPPGSAATNPVRASLSLREELEKAEYTSKILQGDDEDRPPLVEFCVGRDSELSRLNGSNAKVIFITGIGGQGKSTLAAQYFADSQTGRRYSYFVWRDCKEESERFENQLASVVETLSGDKISGQDLAKQDGQSIVQLFINLTADLDALFVFDNADHYVNLHTRRMTATPDLVIQALAASRSNSRIVFTCRPSVEYNEPWALNFHLEGLSLDATRRLFLERRAKSEEGEITDAHELTDGHAFWLDLLSIQVAKQPHLSLGHLLEKIRSAKGELPTQTLNSIWTTLSEHQQLVLRTMAESVRPESVSEISEYLHGRLTYQKVVRSLNALRALNLIVVKPRPAADDVLELHPLVRQFIRQNFSLPERSTFIGTIIKIYKQFIGRHRTQLAGDPSLTILQHWTQAAELDIAAGRIGDAFLILHEAGDAFMSSGYSREYARAVRLLLRSFDWVTDHGKYKSFDDVFNSYFRILAYLGEYSEVDRLLELYELTLADRSVRYVFYCDMKCYYKWVRGEFTDAVHWGERGQKLKTDSGVDTQFDVAHNLALAYRDAGRPELALNTFLEGRDLSHVVDPEELDESRGGPHYGNVGRCLHFMGQIKSALVCYQKSALLLEKGHDNERILNQGFIRRWIGELLIARGQYKLAGFFLAAARLRWDRVSPPRASEIALLQEQNSAELPKMDSISPDEIDRTCRDWILGRYMDAGSV